MQSDFGISTGLFITGTMAGYVVRFLALSFGSLQASLGKITRSMDDAARSLGHRPFAVLRQIYLPMLRASVLTASLLVFVDSMKELLMTLLLRPFNFETLAIFVFLFASDELLEECALSALAIVVVGLGPVIVLSSAIRDRGRAKTGRNNGDTPLLWRATYLRDMICGGVCWKIQSSRTFEDGG